MFSTVLCRASQPPYYSFSLIIYSMDLLILRLDFNDHSFNDEAATPRYFLPHGSHVQPMTAAQLFDGALPS